MTKALLFLLYQWRNWDLETLSLNKLTWKSDWVLLKCSVAQWCSILWRGLSFPSLRDLPDPGIKPTSPASPASAGRFFTTEPPGKPSLVFMENLKGNLYWALAVRMPVWGGLLAHQPDFESSRGSSRSVSELRAGSESWCFHLKPVNNLQTSFHAKNNYIEINTIHSVHKVD